jgi:hypothetical protein
MADFVATVTGVEYVPPAELDAPTPLDPARIVRSVVDHVLVVFDVEAVVGHSLYFDPVCVPNRMTFYDVGQDEAVLALVREVVFGWSSLEPADPTDPVQLAGGTDPRIDVDATAIVGELRAVLDALGDRVLPPPPPDLVE